MKTKPIKFGTPAKCIPVKPHNKKTPHFPLPNVGERYLLPWGDMRVIGWKLERACGYNRYTIEMTDAKDGTWKTSS